MFKHMCVSVSVSVAVTVTVTVFVALTAHMPMNYEARSAVHMLPINHGITHHRPSSEKLHSLTFYRQQLGNQINVKAVALGGRSAHCSDSCRWQPYRTARVWSICCPPPPATLFTLIGPFGIPCCHATNELKNLKLHMCSVTWFK